MKKLLLISTFVMTSIVSSFSQTVGSATVFSQDGEKFWVIVDGIKQNASAQTNVKITGLNHPGYKFKIIFEDAAVPALDQNVMTQDVDGKFNDVTYVVKKNNKGNYVMRVNSFQVASGNTSAESGQVAMAVSSTEAPKTQTTTAVSSPGNSSTTVVHQTTTTTNGNADNANIGMSVSDGAGSNVNFNVNVNATGMDGNGTSTTTTTTTTTHTSTSSSSSASSMNSEPAPVKTQKAGCTYPMSSSDFSNAQKSISSQSFEENKQQVAKQVTKAKCVSSAQIKQIMGLFSFEGSKLDYAKYAYDYCTDKDNYFTLNDAFSFSSSVSDLNEYLEGKK